MTGKRSKKPQKAQAKLTCSSARAKARTPDSSVPSTATKRRRRVAPGGSDSASQKMSPAGLRASRNARTPRQVAQLAATYKVSEAAVVKGCQRNLHTGTAVR